jgi:DNA/RNA-binding domain of Phe-tRNA-synthetase-like protein
VLRIGQDGESYKGIGKDIINIAELPVFADADGPFGSPTSDSERAMITTETQDLMMVVISFTGTETLEEYLQRISGLLCLYASASHDQIETLVI